MRTGSQLFFHSNVRPDGVLTSSSIGSCEQGPAVDLIDRLREGEASAIARAYVEHHVAIRAFAQRLVGDDDLAEDLVHDVFVVLPKALQTFEGRSTLRTFMLSIAIRRAHYYVRGARRRRVAVARYAKEPQRSSSDPERDVTRDELALALTRALDELPLEQRVAFVLCEVEERSSSEAALIAGAPDATMRTRVFHAKRKLRDLLAKRGFR